MPAAAYRRSTRPRGRRAGILAGWGAAIVPAMVVLTGLSAAAEGYVPVPAAESAARVAAAEQLARATREQGVCYGWLLQDGNGSVVSQGSNLGDGVPVRSQPSCSRWLHVEAVVAYTQEWSEAEDFSRFQLTSSPGVALPPFGGLERFGLTQEEFLDDPGWAICQAAMILPLLLAETGAVGPAPVEAPPAGEPAALPGVGSDFWRARGELVAVGAVLLGLAPALAGIGVLIRRRQRPERAGPTSRVPGW